jgi:hypothetical protein
MSYPYTIHCFMPGQTIDAVIKLKGRHDLSPAEMIFLRERFNELNGEQVIRPGMTCKIPLPTDGVEDEGGID